MTDSSIAVLPADPRLPVQVGVGAAIEAADPALPRFALCHVRSGAAVFALGGQRIPVVAPSVILLDEAVRPVISQAHDLQLGCLYFHPKVINSAFATVADLHAPTRNQQFSGSTRQDLFLLQGFLSAEAAEHCHFLAPHVHERIAQLFQFTVRQLQQKSDKFWPCRTRSFLIELLFQLRMLGPTSEVYPVQALGEGGGTRMERALLYLHENYSRDFTLGDMARACHTNRTTLNAEFRTITGMSVRAYTISLRMKVAAAMLRDTQIPVSEIMARVGYGNASHFTRAFRQTLGSAPSDYRQANSWMLNKA